jgi:DNA topoisomerase-1
VLRRFWEPFHETVAEVRERRVAEIIEALNEALAAKLFPPREDGSDPRACPLCGAGRLSLKFGRYGAFVGCSRYPDCRYTRKLGEADAEADHEPRKDRLLGVDPDSREEVWLRHGRFGPYLQRGSGDAAVRSSIPASIDPNSLDLARALKLLALPRLLGTDPDTGEAVEAGINRYGPYVRRGRRFVRLPPDEDVLTIGINRALTLLAEASGRTRAKRSSEVLRELGAHPETGEPVQLLAGRFGPYVRHGKVSASLRRGEDPEALTLDEAVERLAAKTGAARNGKQKKAGRGRRKTQDASRTAATKSTRTRRRKTG